MPNPSPAEPAAVDDHVAPGDRVPLGVKVAAGSGEAAINLGINLPKQFAFPIFNLVLGVSPTLLGIALFVPRLWDALIDPLMGSISDNTRSRWGRRRPYMLVGGVLSALCILLLCVFPRGMAETTWGPEVWSLNVLGWDLGATKSDFFYAGYLMVMSMVFYTALTIFAVPYGALTMELTSDYEERTRVMSFRTLFTYISGLLLGWLYAIAEWDIFKDADGNPDAIKGSYAVGLTLMVVILVAVLVPTLFVRERRNPGAVTAAKPAEPKIGLLAGLRETLGSGTFLLIIAAYTIGFLGVIMVIGIGQYVNFYHVYGGDKDTGSIVQGWAHTCAVVAGIFATFTINRLATRVEKKTLLIGALSVSFVGGLLSWVMYSPDLPTGNLLGWVPDAAPLLGGQNWPIHPLAISYALIFPGLAGLLIMSNSMIADVCDIDELQTGQRREGMYWAVFNWIQKTAISVALLFGGVILDVVGFDSTPNAVQSPEAIFKMRMAYLLVVCGGVGIAIAIVACIPLNKKRIMGVRAELARRADASGGA